MLHVRDELHVVATFASGWPWANANAPTIRSSRAHIVEDSIHPDTPARQYRLHFLMQEHAQVRDSRGRAQTTAYVQSDLLNEPSYHCKLRH